MEGDIIFEGKSILFQSNEEKKVKVRNFNYLMWFFKSDSPTDTAINNVLFDYKINHKNKGVN